MWVSWEVNNRGGTSRSHTDLLHFLQQAPGSERPTASYTKMKSFADNYCMEKSETFAEDIQLQGWESFKAMSGYFYKLIESLSKLPKCDVKTKKQLGASKQIKIANEFCLAAFHFQKKAFKETFCFQDVHNHMHT